MLDHYRAVLSYNLAIGANASETLSQDIHQMPTTEISLAPYNVVTHARHRLHECKSADEFRPCFEEATGCLVENIADHIVRHTAPKAIFLAGSLPLGMGTSGSDVDLIVLIDTKDAQVSRERLANTDQDLEFVNDGDMLLSGISLTLRHGIPVEVQVVLTSAVAAVYRRLRRRGPDLTETEIRTLGRLATGWLLWQSERYMEDSGVDLTDPSLSIYCATRSFVFALLQRSKAARALEQRDIPLSLHHARTSVEESYLAYFASEGLPHLGSKWLAKIGHAYDAPQRIAEHPLLTQGIRLLFPTLSSSLTEASQYLREASEFIMSMRSLIERRVRFRIAFNACPQIASA